MGSSFCPINSDKLGKAAKVLRYTSDAEPINIALLDLKVADL